MWTGQITTAASLDGKQALCSSAWEHFASVHASAFGFEICSLRPLTFGFDSFTSSLRFCDILIPEIEQQMQIHRHCQGIHINSLTDIGTDGREYLLTCSVVQKRELVCMLGRIYFGNGSSTSRFASLVSFSVMPFVHGHRHVRDGACEGRQ